MQQAAQLSQYAAYMQTIATGGTPPPGMPPPGIGAPGMPPMMMPGMPPMGMMPSNPMMPPWPGPMPGGYNPRGAAEKERSPASAGGNDGNKSTVMWKNLPNNYNRDDLLNLVNSHGFTGAYDFFYSPIDFTSSALVGYAFVNF